MIGALDECLLKCKLSPLAQKLRREQEKIAAKKDTQNVAVMQDIAR